MIPCWGFGLCSWFLGWDEEVRWTEDKRRLGCSSLVYPTPLWGITHTCAHSHTQNKTEISMTIVFQPKGVTKQDDHSAFLTGQGTCSVLAWRNHLFFWSGHKPEKSFEWLQREAALLVGLCSQLRNELYGIRKDWRSVAKNIFAI